MMEHGLHAGGLRIDALRDGCGYVCAFDNAVKTDAYAGTVPVHSKSDARVTAGCIFFGRSYLQAAGELWG